jgi:hypothetical protein
MLETETSATGTVQAGEFLYKMPLYQRYVNSTLHLVPGMQAGGYAYGGDLGAYHVAGQRSGAIGVVEDGAPGNDPGAGTATVKPLQNAGRRGQGSDHDAPCRIRPLSRRCHQCRQEDGHE